MRANRGMYAVIFANLIWSGSYTATAVAVTHMSAITLTLIRLGVGAVVLIPFLRLKGGARWTPRSVFHGIWLGIVGFTISTCLENEGLALSTAAIAAVAVAMEPLFTVLISSFLLRERVPKLRIVALVFAFVGAWTIAGCPRPGVTGYLRGDIILVTAIFCYALYNACSKVLTDEVPAVSGTALTLLTGFLSTIPVWLFSHHRSILAVNASTIWSLLYLTLFSTTIAYFLWLLAIQTSNVSIASLFLYLQPVFGVIISMIVLHQYPTFSFYIGGGLILLALYLGRERLPSKQRSQRA